LHHAGGGLRNVIRLFRTAFFQISHLFDIRHLWRCDLHRKSMANLEKQKDPAREEEGFQVKIPCGLFSTGQAQHWLPQPSILHPYPNLRFDAKHPR
jgi:hypothetical protein